MVFAKSVDDITVLGTSLTRKARSKRIFTKTINKIRVIRLFAEFALRFSDFAKAMSSGYKPMAAAGRVCYKTFFTLNSASAKTDFIIFEACFEAWWSVSFTKGYLNLKKNAFHEKQVDVFLALLNCIAPDLSHFPKRRISTPCG